MRWKVAIIGFGNVGQAFLSLLKDKRKQLFEKYRLEFDVVAISDPIKGSIYNGEGLSLEKITQLLSSEGHIKDYEQGERGWDSIQTIEKSNANIVVEATPTNLQTGEPGKSHIEKALNLRKHVITTNKGPIALYYRELSKLASQKGVFLKFEGTVLSGTPAINLIMESLAGSHIEEIRGIVNGTTNFILTEMAKGKSYDEALKEAQKLGYAETDPTADVEGWDAVAKVMILGNVIMGGNLRVEDVKRRGIVGITKEEIERAKQEGKLIKLIGSVKREDGKVIGSVLPIEVDRKDFLAQVGGVTNALTIKTDTLGEITIVGPGAGRIETGFSILSDFISIHTTLHRF